MRPTGEIDDPTWQDIRDRDEELFRLDGVAQTYHDERDSSRKHAERLRQALLRTSARIEGLLTRGGGPGWHEAREMVRPELEWWVQDIGAALDPPPGECQRCGGSGKIWAGQMAEHETPCPDCTGEGT